MIRKVLVCAAAGLMATAVACSKSSKNPASPSAASQAEAGAAADGSTLKSGTPSAVSPINGAQPDQIVLTATKVTGKFAEIAPSYEFEIFNGTTRVYTSGVIAGGTSGSNVTNEPPVSTFDFDTPYTWRVR